MSTKLIGIAALSGALVLTVAGSAAAHVYFNPAEAPSDGYATLNLEVPHGCEGSPTTKVRVQVPPSVPSVTPGRSPFWNITTKEGKKDKVELHGETITSGVSEIVYTARQPLPDGELDVLPVSLKMPAAKEGQVVYFPTVQECEKGETSWIQIPAEGESGEELESPAPAVTLAAAEGEHEAAAAAESQDVQAAGATIDEDEGAPVWLAVVALALGALGLLAGVSALVRSRRNQA